MKKKSVFFGLVILVVMVLLTGASWPGNDIRDYVCRVNVSLHPNIDTLLRGLAVDYWDDPEEDAPDIANHLNALRMGGSGSGFIYVAKGGANYIITNYHVIAGGAHFSVTFEDSTGEQRRFRNLTVFSVDEENDLAMLAFPPDEKPFRRGLPFYSRPVNEGATIASAGFPGLGGGEPQWRRGDGTISNLNHRVPQSRTTNLTTGPYILHSAQVDPGNSGGPLLIADSRSPAKLSVIGVNVAKYNDGSAGTFLAIPLEKTIAFVESSLERNQKSNKEILDESVSQYVALLNSLSSTGNFGALPSYLSTTMVNADPGFVLSLLFKDIPMGGLMFFEDPMVALAYGVIYQKIVNPLESFGDLEVEVLYTEESDFGGYTVMLLINNYTFRTEWIKEYGTYRLRDFYKDNGKLNHYQMYATYLPLDKEIIYPFLTGSDVAWYRVVVPQAGTLSMATGGANIQTQMTLIDSKSNKVIVGNSGGRNPRTLSAKVAAGTYYLQVNQSNSQSARAGEYLIKVVVE